jgi:hypothetical protein
VLLLLFLERAEVVVGASRNKMVVSLASVGYFMPIVSFLLVFIVIFALLAKTKVLGEQAIVHLFISFLLSIMFIVNVSLVDFVNFSSAWFAVFFVMTFLVLVLIAFTHGKLDVIMKPWVAWVLLAFVIIFFIVSSAYTFNWAVNWSAISDWFYSDWFGMVLLLVIAAVVSWVLAK